MVDAGSRIDRRRLSLRGIPFPSRNGRVIAFSGDFKYIAFFGGDEFLAHNFVVFKFLQARCRLSRSVISV